MQSFANLFAPSLNNLMNKQSSMIKDTVTSVWRHYDARILCLKNVVCQMGVILSRPQQHPMHPVT